MCQVEPTIGIAPFGELVRQVMTNEPYASVRQVFWSPTPARPHRNGLHPSR